MEAFELTLWGDGSFTWAHHGCLGVYDQDEGAFRVEKGVVVLVPDTARPPRRDPLVYKRLVPVKWGERQYLIPPAVLPLFREDMRTRNDGRRWRPPLYFAYLRRGDHEKPLRGMPIAPAPYQSQLGGLGVGWRGDASGPIARPAPAPSRVEALVRRMTEIYGSCESYRDTGTVTTVAVHDGDPNPKRVEREFTTTFRRPRRLRFQYAQTTGGNATTQGIVCTWGHVIRQWDAIGGKTRRPTSLASALAEAARTSAGAAAKLPPLFSRRPEQPAWTDDLSGLTVAGQEEIHGVACFKVRGTHADGDVYTLWIDKKTLLLRQVLEQSQFTTFRSETTTTYEPEINIPISPAELVFAPPTSGMP